MRGPHHCVGVANSVTDMIFQFLNSKCAAAGGTLSAADLETIRTHFLESYPKASGYFEATNQRCMEASAGTAHAYFARDTILASALMASSHKATRQAFTAQVDRLGATWVRQFYAGLAQYVRQHVCPEADARLFKIYLGVAGRLGAQLSVDDLLKEQSTRIVLRECVAPFISADAPDKLAIEMSDEISNSIATQRGIPRPDISKVTDHEMRNFLVWLPRQMQVSLCSADS